MELKMPVSQSKSLPSARAINQSQTTKSSNTFLGHYPYNEANQSRLTIIGSYAQEPYQRFEYFDKEAGKALMKLIYAARDEGVWIVPVSGFRDLEKQKLLFETQVEKKGSESAAAKVSAPSGYSEHHTGYAIDLSDGQFPKQDITNEFVNTKAYRWLTLHAKGFGFEMSFPQNNPDGVMFEPWHWRFIGNPDAINTFSNARSLS
jgi:D-alanyl-D-alanine carboxypeptidase